MCAYCNSLLRQHLRSYQAIRSLGEFPWCYNSVDAKEHLVDGPLSTVNSWNIGTKLSVYDGPSIVPQAKTMISSTNSSTTLTVTHTSLPRVSTKQMVFTELFRPTASAVSSKPARPTFLSVSNPSASNMELVSPGFPTPTLSTPSTSSELIRTPMTRNTVLLTSTFPKQTSDSVEPEFPSSAMTPESPARRTMTVPTSLNRVWFTLYPLTVPHTVVTQPNRFVAHVSTSLEVASKPIDLELQLGVTSSKTPARRNATVSSTSIRTTETTLPKQSRKPILPAAVSPNSRIPQSESENGVRISLSPIIVTEPMSLSYLTVSELPPHKIVTEATPSNLITVTLSQFPFTLPLLPGKFTKSTLPAPVRDSRQSNIRISLLASLNPSKMSTSQSVTKSPVPSGTLLPSTPVFTASNITNPLLDLSGGVRKLVSLARPKISPLSLWRPETMRSKIIGMPLDTARFVTSQRPSFSKPSGLSKEKCEDIAPGHSQVDNRSEGSMHQEILENRHSDTQRAVAQVRCALSPKTQLFAQSVTRVLRLDAEFKGRESVEKFELLLSGTNVSDAKSLADIFSRLNATPNNMADIIRSTKMPDHVVVELIKYLHPKSNDALATLMKSISNQSPTIIANVFKSLGTPFTKIPAIIAAIRNTKLIDFSELTAYSGWNKENRAFATNLVKALHPNSTADILALVPLLHSHDATNLADVLQCIDASEDGIVATILEMPEEFSAQEIGTLLRHLGVDSHQRAYILNALLHEGRITYSELGETAELLPMDETELAHVLSELGLIPNIVAIILNSMPSMTPTRLGHSVNHLQLSAVDLAQVLQPLNEVRSAQDLQVLLRQIENLLSAETEFALRSLAKNKTISTLRVRNILNRFRGANKVH